MVRVAPDPEGGPPLSPMAAERVVQNVQADGISSDGESRRSVESFVQLESVERRRIEASIVHVEGVLGRVR